jgi:hypothetical protein
MIDAPTIARVVSPLRVPVDLVVVSAPTFEKWRDTPGNVFHEAASEGKVLYEGACSNGCGRGSNGRSCDSR